MKIIYTGRYKLADRVIEINSIYKYIHEMCCEYKTENSIELKVETTQQDCDYERNISDKTAKAEGHEPIDYKDSYLETLAVYRKIVEALIDDNVILFHGSVVAVDDEAYLFTAKSGTGKSTHTANWRKYFGDRAVMVNDDKPLLKINDNGVIVYGTPWNGKHRLSKNMSIPLKAICILERDSENHIEKTDRKKAYTMLIQQTYKTKDSLNLMKTMNLIDKLAEKTKLYELGCNMDVESAEVAYNGMKG